MSLKEFVAWCVVFMTVCGALTYLVKGYRWAAPYVRHAFGALARLEEGIGELKTEAVRVAAELKIVKHEVELNDGGSLKDEVSCLATDVSIDRSVRRLSNMKATLVWRVNKDGTQTAREVSSLFTDITGLAREDCDRSGWSNMVAPDEREDIVERRRECLRLGEVFFAEYTVVNVHTKKRTRVQHRSEPVLNRQGMIVGWVSEIVPVQEAA